MISCGHFRRAFKIAFLSVFIIGFSFSPALAENKFLDDLFLGVWSPFTSKWETSILVCVATDSNETLYKVTATGSEPGDRFFVVNDIGDRVRYNVFWHFGNNLRRSERLSSGVSSQRNFPFSDSTQCTNGPSAKVRVRMNKNQIGRAPPGIYSDTILLMFSPV